MLGRGVGLIALVERARESAGLDSTGVEGVGELADGVCRFALCGQYRMARAMADLESEYLDDPDDLLYRLSRWPNWWRFAECVHLAGQIDDFLTTREGDPRTAPLARDCRDELDLLLVLADLCEDTGLARSAQESRYLHALVLSVCLGLWATRLDGRSNPPSFSEDDSEME